MLFVLVSELTDFSLCCPRGLWSLNVFYSGIKWFNRAVNACTTVFVKRHCSVTPFKAECQLPDHKILTVCGECLLRCCAVSVCADTVQQHLYLRSLLQSISRGMRRVFPLIKSTGTNHLVLLKLIPSCQNGDFRCKRLSKRLGDIWRNNL